MKRATLLLAFLFSLQLMHAQYTGAKDGVAFRANYSNYVWLLTEDWNNDDVAGGIEVEYKRHLGPALNLSLPFRFYKAHLPTNEMGASRNEAMASLDALLELKYFRESNLLYPYLYAGFGANYEALEEFNYSVPLGVGINLRLGTHTYFSLKGEYRLGLEDLRDNVQAGAGLLFLFGSGDELAAVIPSTDRDGDGIDDEVDLCPDVAGLASLYGCPDSDGDNIPDGEDECPTEAGLVTMNGCPDRDNDGLADKDDECPDEAGLPENNGCPFDDRDKDGVADFEDECPDVAGLASLDGCPDKDLDGVRDSEDRCPNTAGPIANRGCPEIDQADQEVLDFAMQAVQFETGQATLTSDSYLILGQVVDIMRRYPDYKLRISGHTDSVGSSALNQSLSEGRAKSCYDYIISKGISPERVSYTGYGETRPIANNKYKSGREENRRVEFDIYLD